MGSNYKYVSIGPDDGLAPIRRQAIIWTNGGLVYRRIYASLGLNELMYTTEYADGVISICYTDGCFRRSIHHWSSVFTVVCNTQVPMYEHFLHSMDK